MVASQGQLIDVGGRRIGPGAPCFIIAEVGVNHNGRLDVAKRLIEAAAACRVDAVKFQTFCAERITSAATPKAPYQREASDSEESQLEMLRRLELPPSAFGELQAFCVQTGVLFLSTPFDEQSADLLEQLEVPAFKIASGELTNLPFLEHVARKGKPMLVSTGMAQLGEVREAVETIRSAGNPRLVLLHCVSNYPAEPSVVNLRAMQTMAKAFGVPVGYSDHTLGREIAMAAVALGACVIEKHLTLDRSLPGPDHRASIEPGELAALVRGIRAVEAALGNGCKEPARTEQDIAPAIRKSLVASQDIPAGAPLTEDVIAVMRPGTGLAPTLRNQVVGGVARVDIRRGTPLTWELVAPRQKP